MYTIGYVLYTLHIIQYIGYILHYIVSSLQEANKNIIFTAVFYVIFRNIGTTLS